MARASRGREERPPALPPEERTVGQLIAETIRFYGRRFLRVLPLGLVVAVSNQLALERPTVEQTAVFLAAAPFFTLAFADACRLVTDASPPRRAWVTATVAGILVWVPTAVLLPWFKLAVVVLLALVGLVVPVALVEGRPFRAAFGRALALGRADFVHAIGSLAALVVMFGLAQAGLALLLESQADETVRTALFLADVVLGPVLFLGGAILYVDQDARLRSRSEPNAP